MLAAFAGVVQERQGTTDNNDCSAQRDQCRLHLVPRKTKPPTTATRHKLIPPEMNTE
jgi:hypothetical protein